MFTVAVTCVAVELTLLAVMPLDGENCTAETPERLLPLIVRDTVLPGEPLAGLRDAIWGTEAGTIVKGSVLEVPAADVTETFTCPVGALLAMVTEAATCVALAFTLTTRTPVDGENCTPVTPERPVPAIVKDMVLPACPLVGLRDVIVGPGGAPIKKGSALEVPAGDVTETFTCP
jgi:hypothetical protein